jgi:hypothetical protein
LIPADRVEAVSVNIGNYDIFAIESGISQAYEQVGLRDMIYSRHILWAPDGDAAFDDGSYILQFDVDERVRLIAFKGRQDTY